MKVTAWRAAGVAVASMLAGFLLALALHPAADTDAPELPGFYISRTDPAAPDLEFLDMDGNPRRLGDYRGRVLVIFFGFVRCPDVCPTRLFELAELMKQLGPGREQVQVLLATLDPERDRPEILKGYVAAFDPSFGALTGTVDQMATLAQRFYVAYRKVPLGDDYTIDHSAATYLVDAAGRTLYVSGSDTTDEQLLAALRTLTDSQSRR
jgi:protein SCO1/2